MSVDTSRVALLGTTAAPPAMRRLRAGPTTVLLDGIDLRYVRIGRTELVRRVYVAVRDRNWGTIPALVSDLEVDDRGDTFEVRFTARHTSHDIDFSWRGTASGDRNGRIVYSLDGRAERDLQYNRIGICVHHPWRETKGAPFRARTPDGEAIGAFPELIGQQAIQDGTYRALFPAFDRLDVSLPENGSLVFEFEGDLWETEDHRNWTDANFKTYSTPIALGGPFDLRSGEPLTQRMTFTAHDVPAEERREGPIRLTIGAPTGTSVPAIGVGADSDGHELTGREAEVLSVLAPAHLRVEAHLDRDDWRRALAAAQESARRVGASLEISLHLGFDNAGLLAALVEALADGPTVDRVLVVPADGRTGTTTETTSPELVDLVRARLASTLPGAKIGGGTEMYFTEINRTRPQPGTWDFVCFSITPQIHAFTNVDLVENLDAQAENVRSAHALAGGKPIVVSPITLRPRVNFHASAPAPEDPAALPYSVDIRQSSQLAAAWTAGSLKYVAEAGASSVTYFELTGWRGLIERAQHERSTHADFHSRPEQVFPLFHVLADVTGWHGAQVLDVSSDDLLVAVALAVEDQGTIRSLVANLTGADVDTVLGPVSGGVSLRRLQETTLQAATSDPLAFRETVEHVDSVGELALSLAPYEVVTINPR
jgi:hypothetical protein